MKYRVAMGAALLLALTYVGSISAQNVSATASPPASSDYLDSPEL